MINMGQISEQWVLPVNSVMNLDVLCKPTAHCNKLCHFVDILHKLHFHHELCQALQHLAA